MHLSIINLYVNTNTDNIHISLLHMYFSTSICSTIYYTILFEKNRIHPENELFRMFTWRICILSIFIEKMWVKIHLHISIISYIIVIFIVISTGTDFYGESAVEAKWFWLDFHVECFFQCFSIIKFCHNIIIARQKILSS